MKLALACSLILTTIFVVATSVNGQSRETPPLAQDFAAAEKAFDTANKLMEQHKYAEALVEYQKALAILPKETALLFNGGLAAFQSKNYSVAEDLWRRLKTVEPEDWHARAKLVQTFQALNKFSERDTERAELILMRKTGKNEDLSKEFEYCRDQFEVNGLKVMAFEHFELKGDRALRYVFSVLNETEDGEQYRISLGSYELTNSVWRETTKPKPKEGERLFHLDGYYKWGHATFAMLTPEPTYDETRAKVIRILEGKDKPVSSSTTNPSSTVPAEKPKP